MLCTCVHVSPKWLVHSPRTMCGGVVCSTSLSREAFRCTCLCASFLRFCDRGSRCVCLSSLSSSLRLRVSLTIICMPRGKKKPHCAWSQKRHCNLLKLQKAVEQQKSQKVNPDKKVSIPCVILVYEAQLNFFLPKNCHSWNSSAGFISVKESRPTRAAPSKKSTQPASLCKAHSTLCARMAC